MGITSFAVKQVSLGPVKHAQILLQEIELLSAFCNNFFRNLHQPELLKNRFERGW